jgi:hypothetical protein
VVAFDGQRIADVTYIYRAMREGRVRLTTLHMNDKLWAARLGPGWHIIENEYRWMPRRATVSLDMPAKSPARVYVTVYCPRTILDAANGKLTLSVYAGGKPLGTRTVVEGEQQLEFDELSKEMFEQKQVEITLEVNHFVVPPEDGRELGIPVLEVAIKTP